MFCLFPWPNIHNNQQQQQQATASDPCLCACSQATCSKAATSRAARSTPPFRKLTRVSLRRSQCCGQVGLRMFLTAFFCNFVGRPMLSTVINMITSGQPKRRLEDISHAVVVEKEGAPLRRVPNLVRRIAILRRSPNFFCWCARTAPVFAFAPATERFRPPDAKTSQYGSVQEVLSKFAPHATITRLFARCACCWRSAVRDQSQSN